MQPHRLSPHVVFAQDPPPWRDSCYPPRPGGQHVLGTTVSELLAEPGGRSSRWLSSVYARLVVASSGPVLAGNPTTELGQAYASRLERARWLRVAPDADLAAARLATWPALAVVQRLGLGVGSLAPDLVIVAERDPYDRLPMFARSGVWMFQALRELGYDELTVHVVNALDRDQRSQGFELTQLHDAFGPYGPQWLALGAIAHEVLLGQGIEHVTVEHPSHARRFKFEAGSTGYAAAMREAGLEPGPWAGSKLPVVSGPSLLATSLDIPDSPSLKASHADARRAPSAVPTPILDKARMSFVLGEAATLKEAAAKASESPAVRKAIVKLARQQGWEVERERFFAEKREKAKASATEEEAKRIGASRALAWEVTEKMLRRLAKSVDDESVNVYAKDAKAITDIAVTLSEKGDTSLDQEKARLQGLTPEAFAEELRKTLGGLGVPATPPTP